MYLLYTNSGNCFKNAKKFLQVYDLGSFSFEVFGYTVIRLFWNDIPTNMREVFRLKAFHNHLDFIKDLPEDC